MHACLCLQAGAHTGPRLLSFQARDLRHHETTQDESRTSKLDTSLIDTLCEPEYDVSPPLSLHIQRRLEVLEQVASAPGPSRWLHAYCLHSDE